MENKTKESIESSLQLEFEYPFAKIYSSEEGKFICAKWFGIPTVEQIKIGCQGKLDALSKNKFDKIISDTSEVKGTWTGAMDWLMTEWWPKAVEIGLRKMAFVHSSDVFAKFSLESFVKKGDAKNDPVDQNTFKTFDDALEWITKD